MCPGTQCCEWLSGKKWSVIAVLLFFIMSILLIILAWMFGIRGGFGSLNDSDPENLEHDGSQISMSNMNRRIQELESTVLRLEELVRTSDSDCRFFSHRPASTIEEGSIPLVIPNWKAALDKDLQESSSYSFDAGETLGSKYHSTWSLYLSSDNKTVSIHLAVDKWSTITSLFAGFRVHVLASNGSIFLSRSHEPVDVLKTLVQKDRAQWHEISIPNILSLKDMPQVLRNKSTFEALVTFELIGRGHRLYKNYLDLQISHKDVKTVEFVVNITNSSRINYFSHFDLLHSWGTTSKWTAHVFQESTLPDSVSFTLHLNEVVDSEVDWTNEFFGSYTIEVIQFTTEPRLLATGTSGLHNFIERQQHSLTDVFRVQDVTGPEYLVAFKLQITTYNKNARYYSTIR